MIAEAQKPSQGLLFKQSEEPSLYLDQASEGYFSVLTIQRQKDEFRRYQNSYRLSLLPQVIEAIDPTIDSYISQATFERPNRRLVNFRNISLAYIDVDCYKADWARGKTPEQLTQDFLYFCRQEGVFEPSLIVFSGRGLQVKWLFERPVPRQALPRWNALEKELIKKFEAYGADPQAKDASRVLRLTETVNTKSGLVCRLTYVNEDKDGLPVMYGFDHFFFEHTPISRDELKAIREERLLQKIERAKRISANGFTLQSLYWARLEDLRVLSAYRSVNGVLPEGQRMTMLFLMLVCMAHSKQVDPATFFQEAYALAQRIDPEWKVTQTDVSAIYGKLKETLSGKMVEFHGHKYPPLYTPTNDTIIQLLTITEKEQRELQLKTLISYDEKLRRNNIRREKERREAGILTREAYDQDRSLRSYARADRAKTLAQEGFSQRQIAEKMNLSKTAIQKYLSQ